MVNEKMQKELNAQINDEFWSAYLYLSMSAWFTEHNLPGFANWMYVQFQEEQTHAMKFLRYVHSRGGSVALKPIKEVPTSWKSPADVFDSTLKQEQIVTSKINHLMEVAVELKDYATQNLLTWYIDEQIEEEANAGDILAVLKAIENNPRDLIMYDKELSGRTFVNETMVE
jgi:ferritin